MPRSLSAVLAGCLLVACGGMRTEPTRLAVDHLAIQPCPTEQTRRLPPTERGAECYILSGQARNPGPGDVRNVDLYGVIIDAQGTTIREGRIGTIRDMRARTSTDFAVRVLFPRGSVREPLRLTEFRARGLS